LEVSEGVLAVELPAPVVVGSLLRLEWEDVLVLGETRHCRAAGTGLYTAGVKVEHALLDTAGLVSLSKRLLGYSETETADALVHRNNQSQQKRDI
jgi:hypothetical protein